MYTYATNCTESTAEAIDALMGSAREVTYGTVCRHIGERELREVFPGYAWEGRRGVALKDDWHVSYYRGRYEGQRCYVVQHSMIEYIFTHNSI